MLGFHHIRSSHSRPFEITDEVCQAFRWVLLDVPYTRDIVAFEMLMGKRLEAPTTSILLKNKKIWKQCPTNMTTTLEQATFDDGSNRYNGVGVDVLGYNLRWTWRFVNASAVCNTPTKSQNHWTPKWSRQTTNCLRRNYSLCAAADRLTTYLQEGYAKFDAYLPCTAVTRSSS